MSKIASPGSRVLDLGGHIGAFSLMAAASGYEVVTVEASPRNAALIHASVKANGWSNMRVLNAGVSDAPGSLPFLVDGPYGHVATGAEQDDGRFVVNVPAVTVDDLLVEIGWDRPDFIKMDIEGSEVAALRGMAGLLAGPNAPPIYYESNGHTLAFYGQSTKNLKASAAGAGYVNYLVVSGELVPVSTEDFQGQTCVDYLALKTVPSSLTVAEGLPLAVQISHLRESVEHPEVAGRLYAVRALQDAPAVIREHPEARRLLYILQNDDPSHEVREAALALGAEPIPESPTPNRSEDQEPRTSWVSKIAGILKR